MIVNANFHAPWWLRSPHLQTLFASRVRRIAPPSLQRERLQTPDNDFLDLDWFGQVHDAIVIICHGLEGSSNSNYARGLMQTLSHAGLGGAVMHFRGCSGEPNRKPQSYHCAHTHDIAWVLNTLADRHPNRKLIVVGYSIGGAAVLNTLALEELPAQLLISLAISPPFEPRAGADRMNQGFSRIYQKSLVQDCIRSIKAKLASGIELPIDNKKLNEVKSFWQFDHHVNAPLHGFSSAEDYYQRAAPRQRLRDISRLCHIIHATDDPFFDANMIPKEQELGVHTTLELSRQGGHVGFVCGSFGQPHYWLEMRITELVETTLNDTHACC